MNDDRKIFSHLDGEDDQNGRVQQPSDIVVNLSERLERDLHSYYQAEKQANQDSLHRAWSRIAPRLQTSEHTAPQSSSFITHRSHQGRIYKVQATPTKHTHKRGFRPQLALLVAIIILAILAGIPLVFRMSHQEASQPVINTNSTGKIVYTTTPRIGYVSDIAWSADSERLADINGQIWDALTGNHRVSVKLPGQTIVAIPSWSPINDTIVFSLNNGMVIVDGQTGDILHTITMPLASIAPTIKGGSGYLSSAVELGGGGVRYSSVAWSPDGKYFATTFSEFGGNGEVQIWNAQTAQLASTLAVEPDTSMSALAWSSDDKYIAADTAKWDTSQYILQVWNVNSHQIVFQQSGDKDYAALSWQPHTDNLAFAPSTNTFTTSGLQIWNITTHTQIKNLPDVTPYGMTWAPDGSKIVYANWTHSAKSGSNATNTSTIMDINTGQKVYTSAPSNSIARAGTPAWSPNGKYIAVSEQLQQPASKNGTANNVTPIIGSDPTNNKYVVAVWLTDIEENPSVTQKEPAQPSATANPSSTSTSMPSTMTVAKDKFYSIDYPKDWKYLGIPSDNVNNNIDTTSFMSLDSNEASKVIIHTSAVNSTMTPEDQLWCNLNATSSASCLNPSSASSSPTGTIAQTTFGGLTWTTEQETAAGSSGPVTVKGYIAHTANGQQIVILLVASEDVYSKTDSTFFQPMLQTFKLN